MYSSYFPLPVCISKFQFSMRNVHRTPPEFPRRNGLSNSDSIYVMFLGAEQKELHDTVAEDWISLHLCASHSPPLFSLWLPLGVLKL